MREDAVVVVAVVVTVVGDDSLRLLSSFVDSVDSVDSVVNSVVISSVVGSVVYACAVGCCSDIPVVDDEARENREEAEVVAGCDGVDGHLVLPVEAEVIVVSVDSILQGTSPIEEASVVSS